MRNGTKARLEFLVRGDVVLEFTLVVLVVGDHVEVARTCEAKEDGLRLAGLAAALRLADGLEDGVRALGRGQDGSSLANCSAAAKTSVCLTATASM